MVSVLRVLQLDLTAGKFLVEISSLGTAYAFTCSKSITMKKSGLSFIPCHSGPACFTPALTQRATRRAGQTLNEHLLTALDRDRKFGEKTPTSGPFS